MTDNSNNRGGGGRGRPPQGPDSRRPSSRPSSGDRPFRKREGDDRPARTRTEGSDKPFRARSEGGDRPQRRDGDRPFVKRDGGDKPFRARSEGGDRPQRRDGDRPFAKRDGGDKPFRARTEGGDRPQRRPGSDRPQRSEGGERPFYKRDAGAKSYGPRPEGFVAQTRERSETDHTPRPRFEDRGRSARSNDKGAAPAPRREFTDRIAKVMARAGLCSRRDAEAWIEAGRVSVNGEVIKSPALDVTHRDRILVDDVPLPMRERTRLFLYHKPRGLVTTAFDPEGRPTVFSSLPAGLPRVITIGRLDINTEGLLLLTNDGGLARVVALPDTGWLRRYRVRCYGDITQNQLDNLRDGVTIDGMHYGPIEAEIQREVGDNVWLTLGLREGKNREVKRILEHLGLQVNRLIRISFGPFQLNDLAEGAVEEVRTSVLQDQLGEALTLEADADFDAPVFVYEDEDFHPKKREHQDWDERERKMAGRKPKPTGRVLGEAGSSHSNHTPTRGDARGGPKGREEQATRFEPRDPTLPARSVWRADEDEGKARPNRTPRRGEDPKVARAESAERAHTRAGTVKSRTGKSVLVERVVREQPVEAPRESRRTGVREGGEERVFKSGPREEKRGRPQRGERPQRSDGDRPMRSRSDRPQRDGERSFTPRGDRPARDGDRPFVKREDRPRRGPNRAEESVDNKYKPWSETGSREARPARGGDGLYQARDDSRPGRGSSRPGGFGDKPRGPRAGGDRPSGDKPFRSKPSGDKPSGSRPATGRSFGGKPAGGNKTQGTGRPFGGKPGGGRPSGGVRPGGDRPRGPRRES